MGKDKNIAIEVAPATGTRDPALDVALVPSSETGAPLPAGPSAGAPRPGSPPPIPRGVNGKAADRQSKTAADADPEGPPSRRVARRRPAGPVRGQIAANDDAPSIGGLIYALEQQPSNKPFQYAAIASAIWVLISVGFVWAIFAADLGQGTSIGGILSKPTTFLTAAAIVVPIAVLWFLALLAWRSEELRLRSSTMTEVAIRLAEPDRMAEQSVASLGQAVRRQVSFMNDAVSRALGRAGELEALVHNEVSALERSYEENERKIRGLIQELTGERHALVNTSERVTDTLKHLGTDVPALIEKLSNQQVKLANIIQGAGENLTALESAVGQSAQRLETTLGARTDQLQNVLEGYTDALGNALGSRTEQMQNVLETYTSALASALGSRSDHLQTVFEEYGRALDTTLAKRAENLDHQLIERTRSLDAAFNERLRLFDESILRSTLAIDSAVGEKSRALTSALDNHAKTFSETITRQSLELDDSLMQGISSVRRTSENITRQSLKAIEGLAGQSEMLKNVSENLLGQIHSVTNRFENQGQVIMKAANALESANYKIDLTLQNRHGDLTRTLDKLSGRADEFGRFIEGYSSSIEGSMTDAEARARAVAEQLKIGTETTKRTAMADLERFKSETESEGDRALDELRRRFSTVSSAVNEQLSSLSSRLDQTSDEVRQRTQRAAAEIATEQARLREQMERMPAATRESTDAMRRALQDQIAALEQLSELSGRQTAQRDVSLPVAPSSLTASYVEGGARTQPPALSPSVASELKTRPPAPRPGETPRTQPPPAASLAQRLAGPAAADAAGRDAWSLGDLLARASRDEEGHGHAASLPAQGPFQLNIEIMARALDPTTAAAIWTRVRAGARGVMARNLYSAEGRVAFDEVNRRCATDQDLMRTIFRYLADFERIQREAEQKDPSGRLVQNQLVSDMGRVYLFLAHASGRLV